MTPFVLGAVVALVVGDLLHRHAPRPIRRRARRPLSARHRRGLAVLALVAMAALTPALPALVAITWWSHRRWRDRRAERTRAMAVRHALPDTVHLLVLATTVGLSLPVAHPLVAGCAPAPLGPALEAADRAASAGRARADALGDQLAPLGERAHALADVLRDHLRYGVPLLPALERTSLELRLDRRRAAEVEARRVPVRLLFPLVTCVLPAFALLTVVPLLAASLDALPT